MITITLYVPVNESLQLRVKLPPLDKELAKQLGKALYKGGVSFGQEHEGNSTCEGFGQG